MNRIKLNILSTPLQNTLHTLHANFDKHLTVLL